MKKFLAGLLVGLILATALPAAAAVYGQYQGYDIVKVLVNGKEVKSDVPAVIMNGRTMVPLRFVSEAFGANVGWDDSTATATVKPLVQVVPDEEFKQIAATIIQRISERQELQKELSEQKAKQLKTENIEDLVKVTMNYPQGKTGTLHAMLMNYLTNELMYNGHIIASYEAADDGRGNKEEALRAINLAKQLAPALAQSWVNLNIYLEQPEQTK